MSPRFPQELFDHIIDYACHNRDALKSYSAVCKPWAVRSRYHLFKNLHMCHPAGLDRWCQWIPPTADGPSGYVKTLYTNSGVVPLVRETQPLDQHLSHFSAFTQVVELTLVGYHGDLHPDMISQYFTGFRNTLRSLVLASSSLGFNEASQIFEFFSNLKKLYLWSPESPCSRSEDEQRRRASFPRLRDLNFHLPSKSPSLENPLLSGFAEASMDLEALSVVGGVSNSKAVQKMVDSSASSLLYLTTSPFDLDLSACGSIQHIAIYDILHSYSSSRYTHDSLNKHLFERTLSTIQSPVLRTISVCVTNNIVTGKNKTVALPKSDWRGVDSLLCDLLTRIRKRTRDPSWTFLVRITGYFLHGKDNPSHFEGSFTDFEAMGGTVVFLAHRD